MNDGVITPPQFPAEHGYEECPWAEEMAASSRRFDEKLADVGSWLELDTVDGVTARSTSPDSSGNLPTLLGRTFIRDVTPRQVLAAIHIPDFRSLWDSRLERTASLHRYSLYSLQFYSVLRGIGLLFWPRDITGVEHALCFDASGQAVSHANDADDEIVQRIDLTFMSVTVPEVPHQPGKVRGFVEEGFRLERRGSDVEVTNVIKVELGSPPPGYLFSTLCREIPSRVGCLRRAIETTGFPPHVVELEDRCLTVHFQEFRAGTKTYVLRARAEAPGAFTIVYDARRTYRGGILLLPVQGDGAEGVRLEDQGGKVLVHLAESAVRQKFFITMEPREKPKVTTTGWW